MLGISTVLMGALPALAQVGSGVLGRQLDDLVRMKTRLGTVKLHELEIPGPVETTPPAPPAKYGGGRDQRVG